jgi:hypothetical protein
MMGGNLLNTWRSHHDPSLDKLASLVVVFQSNNDCLVSFLRLYLLYVYPLWHYRNNFGIFMQRFCYPQSGRFKSLVLVFNVKKVKLGAILVLFCSINWHRNIQLHYFLIAVPYAPLRNQFYRALLVRIGFSWRLIVLIVADSFRFVFFPIYDVFKYLWLFKATWAEPFEPTFFVSLNVVVILSKSFVAFKIAVEFFRQNRHAFLLLLYLVSIIMLGSQTLFNFHQHTSNSVWLVNRARDSL